ncbi:hypothetical protein BJX76DRAFT_338803 [Aspergillus varians]
MSSASTSAFCFPTPSTALVLPTTSYPGSLFTIGIMAVCKQECGACHYHQGWGFFPVIWGRVIYQHA